MSDDIPSFLIEYLKCALFPYIQDNYDEPERIFIDDEYVGESIAEISDAYTLKDYAETRPYAECENTIYDYGFANALRQYDRLYGLELLKEYTDTDKLRVLIGCALECELVQWNGEQLVKCYRAWLQGELEY